MNGQENALNNDGFSEKDCCDKPYNKIPVTHQGKVFIKCRICLKEIPSDLIFVGQARDKSIKEYSL